MRDVEATGKMADISRTILFILGDWGATTSNKLQVCEEFYSSF